MIDFYSVGMRPVGQFPTTFCDMICTAIIKRISSRYLTELLDIFSVGKLLTQEAKQNNMTLAFSQELNGQKTYFPEKIWKGLDFKDRPVNGDAMDWAIKLKNSGIISISPDFKAKIHTIRKDKSKRWKVGNDIHFVINNRTPQRFQFAPVIKVKHVQDIFIDYDEEACNWFGMEPVVKIDDTILGIEELEKLAVNDGFENASEFCKYFHKNFTGKLIHWTDYRY